MTRFPAIVILLLCGLLLPQTSAAQADVEALEAGKQAFRENQFAEAARLFEEAGRLNPENAEAFFLQARVYAETSLSDRRKATRALDRALEIEPENLRYLVGRLELLREEAGNFITERIREARRLDLARHILTLDPANAYAHEELGASYIRDFWRYRNAMMLPTLRFSARSMTAGTNEAALSSQTLESQMNAMIDPLDPVGYAVDPSQMVGGADFANFDPNAVFVADRFDLEALRDMGVPVQDLTARATRVYDRAVGHLEQALESDPRRRSAYDRLMEIYALKGEYAEALSMLENMYVFFAEDAATWWYLGMAHYHGGSMEAASKAFETAFRYMTEAEKDAFNSLSILLPDDERQRYEEDPVAYASRFWTSKDPRYLTPYNERRLEHFARLVYADLLYGAPGVGLRGWETQRGQILVRYGVPKIDVTLIPQNSAQTALVMNAQRREALQAQDATGAETGAWERKASVRDGSGLDMAAEANTINIWDYGDFRFVFEDPFRNGEYRLYSPSASEIAAGVHPWINDYAIRARETFRKVPERYEYEVPGRQIEMPYRISVFKGEDDRADLYVHYGIPITDHDGTATINLTARIGAFLIGSDRDLLVERRRTIYGLRSSQIVPFSETNLWVDTQEMSAPAGEHQVSMEFETTGGGTVAVQRRAVSVPDFSQVRLALSDVLLAYHIEDVPDGKPLGDADIVRRGLSMTPAPWSVFPGSRPIYLYFEVYGLRPSAEGETSYSVEAQLTPKDQSKGLAKLTKRLFGGARGVSVSLPATGMTVDDGQYLILDAANQETGLYTLVVRVHDRISGRAVEKEQDLFLE